MRLRVGKLKQVTSARGATNCWRHRRRRNRQSIEEASGLHASEARDDGVRLLYDDAVCLNTPAPEKEGNTPKAAAVAQLGRTRCCVY
eukprot:3297131-Pleurochrysis_carterae.AAC.1